MTGRICGTGSYVPARIVENEELANLVDTNDAWIRERTGIARRHLAEQETTSYMAAMAAKRALAQAGMLAEEVDLILVATSTPETVFPCTACEVQREIQAEHAAGFDLNAACSGFLFALQTACLMWWTGETAVPVFYSETEQEQLSSGQKRGGCLSRRHIRMEEKELC